MIERRERGTREREIVRGERERGKRESERVPKW